MNNNKPNMIQSVNDLAIKLKMKFDKIHFGKWVAIKNEKILMFNTDLKILMAEVKEIDKSENINYMLVPLA
jgi:phenolic acid decarboxylase